MQNQPLLAAVRVKQFKRIRALLFGNIVQVFTLVCITDDNAYFSTYLYFKAINIFYHCVFAEINIIIKFLTRAEFSLFSITSVYGRAGPVRES